MMNFNHPYNEDKCIERLMKEYHKHNNLIVAFDFDNTVFDYHNDGGDYSDIIDILDLCHQLKFTLVLYTCETSTKKLAWKINWCKEHMGFKPDYVNSSPVLNNITSNGKIYYNILLDDRAGLNEAYSILVHVISNIEGEKGIYLEPQWDKER